MPVKFNDNFWRENARTLRKPDLACLRQDAQNYKTILLQLNGEIGYDESGIWLVGKEEASFKFTAFFDRALFEEADLAITPEYSCPWSVISSLISSGKHPSSEKLWIVGCQSICPSNLMQVIDENKDIIWIVDENLIKEKIQTEPNKFFDPVCCFLNTVNDAGELKRVIIIQFKNYPFGGAEAIWERDNLILGDTFYVISNEFESTRLVTLICSDSLNVPDFTTVQNGKFLNVPLLIVHIQLNQKPFKDTYKNYRNLLFSKGTKDLNKEIICLNWARFVTYKENDVSKIFNHYGGSGFYIKSENLNREDDRVNENHALGLYYAKWHAKRSHIYFLNFNEFVFVVENTKPSQALADPTQFNRSGPRLLQTFSFLNNAWKPVTNKVCDGFFDVLSEIEAANQDLSCLKSENNFVNVERLVHLSNGDIESSKEWFLVANLRSFSVQDNEINNRILFNQDPDDDALRYRKKQVMHYSVLKNGIISNSDNLLPGLQDLEVKYVTSKVSADSYLINLYSKQNNRKATGIYLGTCTKQDALKIYQKVANMFTETQQGKMVMIWYEQPNGRMREPENAVMPTIKENVSRPANSFRRKRKP